MDQLTKNNITHILAIHDNAQPVLEVYIHYVHVTCISSFVNTAVCTRLHCLLLSWGNLALSQDILLSNTIFERMCEHMWLVGTRTVKRSDSFSLFFSFVKKRLIFRWDS